MKTIALTLFAAALGLAQNQSTTTKQSELDAATNAARAPKATGTATQKKKPAQPAPRPKAAAQSQAQTIPAGATQVESNLYRFTDSSGKTWNYRQTPFGISKWEETSTPAAQPTPPPAQVKNDPVAVTDLGDSYRFEKKTPFGASTWVRKKSELTDEEKALTTNPPANGSSVDSKPARNQ
jgi:hypothetical protein